MTALPPSLRQGKMGFSLIEMLAVLVIIGILIGAASVLSLPRPTPLQAAEMTAAAIEQIRMEALSSGRPTALLILSEPDDAGRLAKFQTIRQTGVDESDNTSLWEPVAAPVEFGIGILLKESECTSDDTGSPTAKMRLPWRGGREGEGLEWIAFGFSGNGTPLQPGGRIVFGRGSEDEFTNAEEDAAIILSNNGRPTPAFNFAALTE